MTTESDVLKKLKERLALSIALRDEAERVAAIDRDAHSAYANKLIPSLDAAGLYSGDVFWLKRAIWSLNAINYGKGE